MIGQLCQYCKFSCGAPVGATIHCNTRLKGTFGPSIIEH